ncbi:hypothetical protein GQ602_001634 [Ophiocordyceps camponoti-floridani]|uniref:Uncharacterized protein n=1 Tax=Ophiocordyceps camponoti-floridani TaxID=2030778 RepID=A0A8H4QEN1_9HYPO|nr:hypothetical protein GQ602_001634 [Ophiocordyceps camponoti-floridani]
MKFTTVAVCLASTAIAAPAPMSQEQAAINAGIVPDVLLLGIKLDGKLNKPLKDLVGSSGLLHQLLSPILDLMLGPNVDTSAKVGPDEAAHEAQEEHEVHEGDGNKTILARDVQSAAASAGKKHIGGAQFEQVLVPQVQIIHTNGLLGKLLNPVVKLLLGDTIGFSTRTFGGVTSSMPGALPLKSLPHKGLPHKGLPPLNKPPPVVNDLPVDDDDDEDDE